ncbi:MAG: DNA polymerase III subunit gamma/tau [Helicobacteraceae bacterium]|jgi:DNA polymerase-3 subunit gamma/tau|nr:DNA polymerase III subunit gamma/tau [Helicobacteraceae bacterium]
MSEHQVLALKYRPRSFKELIGQEAVSQTLSLALDSGKLSHAYLFSGLRGSGKTSSARIFAKSLLCEKGVSSSPCDICDACIQANEGRHIDIIEMDAASNTGVDDVRDLIEQTKYAPSIGRFKIFIIDEVHMLSKGAFNAFLKTLEEPPSYIKFMLATTDPMKVPATILSRSQHFRFKKIAYDAVLAHIKHIMAQEGIPCDDERALEIVARSGGGSMRDTLTLMEQAIAYGKGRLELNATVEMLGVLDPERIEAFFARIFERDNDGAIAFVKESESGDCEMVVSELIGFLKEKLFKPQGHFNANVIERFFKIAAETRSLLHYGADGGFALGLMALKMIEALRPESVAESIERIENELAQEPLNVPAITIAPASPPKDTKKAPFSENALIKELLRRLYDRSAELGAAYNEAVKFIAFESGEFRAVFTESGEAIERLRRDYKIFSTILREVFGADTKIVKIAPETKSVEAASQPPKESKTDAKTDAPKDSISAKAAIQNDPQIQKAIEIFQPEKIVVHEKP